MDKMGESWFCRSESFGVTRLFRMRTDIQSRLRFWTVALVLLPMLSCRSERYRMGVVIPAGTEAELLVFGNDLRIEVDNEGPGIVLLEFDSPDDALDEKVEFPMGTTTRSMPGPVRLRCTAIGTSGTSVDVRAWGANGMSLDQTPEPRTSSHE